MRTGPALRVWLLWVLVLAAGACLAARDPLDEPRFVSVGDTRSISDGVVTALAQDDRGLLWIGTPVGLVRHDGYQLRAVMVEGLPGQAGGSSFVRSLLAAPGGVLWVGLEGEGLARYETARQRWRRWGADPTRPDALAHGSVRALALDPDGALWVGTTGGGLHRLAAGSETFEHFRHGPDQLPDDRIQSLLVDRQGDLWIGTWNGLVHRDRRSGRFTRVLADAAGPDSLAGRIVSLLGEGPDGRLWVGTRQGDLVLLDPPAGPGTGPLAGPANWLSRARTTPGGEVLPGSNAMLDMAWAHPNEVWVSRDDGIDLRDAANGRLIKRLQRDLAKPWGVAGDNVVALLRDRSGQVWVGSYGGGLQRYSPAEGLWVRRSEGERDGVLAEGDTRSLWQMADGQIWAGMSDRGIAILDPQLRLQREIRLDATARVGVLGAITQGPDGSVWVGSEGQIHQFDATGRRLRDWPAGQGRVRRLLATADGAIWAGTGDGVYWRGRGAAGFQRLLQPGGESVSGNINALVQGADGSTWVGGNNGLFVVPPGSAGASGAPELQAVRSQPGQGLRKTVVLGLLSDSRGTLWVDTNAGLHRLQAWDGRLARFERLVESQAVGGGSVGANLLEDRQGRIWTHQMVFDPRDGSHYELSPADGADIGTGWFRSYVELQDGRLLFGGSTGILVVEPERFRPWAYVPPVVATELRVAGERVAVGDPAATLTLRPDQRNFSLEFAALDFTQSDRNRYRYRLLGLEKDWIETGADFRVASYGNLAPGRYRLQVQGSNRIGQWSDQQLELPVDVLPAWWQLAWVRALAVLAGVLLVLAVVQLRTRLLRQRQMELEAKVRERTEALESLSRELQRKSEALEASSLTDPLTGLRNRRFLTQHIEADIAQAVRRYTETPDGPPSPPGPGAGGVPHDSADLVFFLIDIDHFKLINDQHGHAAGDAVLVQMRDRLLQAFRQSDHLVRWGGEEFLIAARATSRERAPELAERARAAVANTPFVLDNGVHLHRTCSVGFAAFPPAPQYPAALDWTAVVDMADTALYAVKRSGRNGWLGAMRARADSAQDLRRDAAQPMVAWARSGGLELAGSEGRVQTWLDEAASVEAAKAG